MTTATGLRAGLRGFREVRRLAYECADSVAARREPRMPFILDLAPVYRGCTADIGRSGALGPYRFSAHPPRAGLWAVEPRPGLRGTGAKFEEILVVTDSADPEESAFWLDDDLPHVRRWAEET
ncbi:hypothetical protein C4J65_16795 [Streptomyces sp. CB09001]|uniref:hypothetical protein n=1 Tax=Streptomyces sp. CB09001 TaxID=2083284 RepID=UPI000E21582D|nr:hypothetical protein [Streptomyces sp. CB09001]AXL93336.1 hypothetical protein C4J65_16795 [Streptomyces sp. CB09001]